ncbi:MAG: P-loop NTPase fold protein, partial [Alphaproteobacteria bacterium]|nr:P-loop NTPase fold protein [Alphaproteobacteria bacterium]
MADSSILLDFSVKQDVRKLTKNEFVQIAAAEKLGQLITQQLSEVDKFLEQKEAEQGFDSLLSGRAHNTITIQGTRGSGKTSFIRNILHDIRHNSTGGDARLLGKGVDYKSLVVLDVFDPTLIENKQNVFVLVLACIKEKVEKVYKDASKQKKTSYSEWQDKLRDLAQGLSLMDGVGGELTSTENWEDAVYILQKGLKKAHSGQTLEEKFHDFVTASLKLIEAHVTYKPKAFVIAIDDVDTDFSRAWPMLETLRRYLTSPQLILILSGDLNLYSMLIRQNMWRNFGNELLDHDLLNRRGRQPDVQKGGATQISEMIDHLEGQYLQKILSPSRRIDLKTLGRLLRDGQKVDVKKDGAVDAGEIQFVVGGRLKKLLSLQDVNGDVELYRALMFGLPMRFTLQIIDALLENKEEDSVVKILTIFTDVLMRHGLSASEVAEMAEIETLQMLVKFLIENDLWAEG